jgi:hypothetical protein
MTIKINSERPMILGGPELKRRLALRRIGALAGLTAIGGTTALLGACGGGGGGSSPPPTAPPSPSLGAHALGFGAGGAGADPTIVQLNPLTSSGSTILVCVGRGQINQHVAPTDNRGNTYAPLDVPHIYGTRWAISGTALYASSPASGGVNEISASNNLNQDEITVAVVEILNGGVIEDLSWLYNEAVPGPTQTSDPVTTNGPATLVAFWWGDANAHPQTAVPRGDFILLDSVLDDPSGQWVQCAVAVKNVSAGVHTVTWEATPHQDAQLYLVAVRSAN